MHEHIFDTLFKPEGHFFPRFFPRSLEEEVKRMSLVCHVTAEKKIKKKFKITTERVTVCVRVPGILCTSPSTLLPGITHRQGVGVYRQCRCSQFDISVPGGGSSSSSSGRVLWERKGKNRLPYWSDRDREFLTRMQCTCMCVLSLRCAFTSYSHINTMCLVIHQVYM